jgi:hypothetical protein
MSGRSRGIVRSAITALLLLATGMCRAADAPPSAAPAPAAHAVKLVNADFEAKPAIGGGIEGWETASHATANAYTFDLDDKVKHAGKASLRIRRNGKEPWGMAHQTLPAAGLAGRTLAFSAWLRTDKASGEGAILTLRTLAGGAVGSHVFMDPPVTGTRDWKRYSVRLAIPRSTSVVEIGAMLQGDGTLWLDDAELVALP